MCYSLNETGLVQDDVSTKQFQAELKEFAMVTGPIAAGAKSWIFFGNDGQPQSIGSIQGPLLAINRMMTACNLGRQNWTPKALQSNLDHLCIIIANSVAVLHVANFLAVKEFYERCFDGLSDVFECDAAIAAPSEKDDVLPNDEDTHFKQYRASAVSEKCTNVIVPPKRVATAMKQLGKIILDIEATVNAHMQSIAAVCSSIDSFMSAINDRVGDTQALQVARAEHPRECLECIAKHNKALEIPFSR